MGHEFRPLTNASTNKVRKTCAKSSSFNSDASVWLRAQKKFSPGIFTMLTMKSHTLSSVIIGKLAELYHHCSHTSITWPGVATEEHFGSGQLRQWT